MSTEKNERTTMEELHELHRLMTDIFLTHLRSPEEYGVNAYFLGVVRQFLKDNGITKNLPQSKDIQTTLEDLGNLDVPFLPALQ